jgi:hypothetical protein
MLAGEMGAQASIRVPVLLRRYCIIEYKGFGCPNTSKPLQSKKRNGGMSLS